MGKRWVLAVALAACTPAGGGAGGGFRVFYPDQAAKAGEHVEIAPAATCNYPDGRQARWATTGAQVTSGALPPGVSIIDGAINGVPKQRGTFSARVTFAGVTCAGKAQPDQQVDVKLVVR